MALNMQFLEAAVSARTAECRETLGYVRRVVGVVPLQRMRGRKALHCEDCFA
jgi:hypothetical protein